MSDETNNDKTTPAQRPRSPRVPVDFAVVLEGRSGSTPGGEPFHVQAEAVKVSRGGATLITDVPVEIGAVVRLTPPFGRTIDAEVNGVWIDQTDGKQRIGVKLLEPNGWFAD